MNEFHGWMVIIESYKGETYDWNNQISILKDIEKKIEDYKYYDDIFIELRKMYQFTHLIASGETKRRCAEIDEVIELFRYTSVIAPGSYGILYLRDECSKGFVVYKAAKGKFEEVKDPFLSPCIPAIEDEFL